MSKVIIFPTDTVYGIGTPLFDQEGLKKIYDLKGRTFDKPIGLLVSKIEDIEKICIVTKDFYRLAYAFWPGALTIVLPVKAKYQDKIGLKTLGVRIPKHNLAIELINEYGPLRTTSCNLSGQEELNDYKNILKTFDKKVDHIYENSEKISEVSSTVLSLCNGFQMIREGNITVFDIEKIIKV